MHMKLHLILSNSHIKYKGNLSILEQALFHNLHTIAINLESINYNLYITLINKGLDLSLQDSLQTKLEYGY